MPCDRMATAKLGHDVLRGLAPGHAVRRSPPQPVVIAWLRQPRRISRKCVQGSKAVAHEIGVRRTEGLGRLDWRHALRRGQRRHMETAGDDQDGPRPKRGADGFGHMGLPREVSAGGNLGLARRGPKAGAIGPNRLEEGPPVGGAELAFKEMIPQLEPVAAAHPLRQGSDIGAAVEPALLGQCNGPLDGPKTRHLGGGQVDEAEAGADLLAELERDQLGRMGAKRKIGGHPAHLLAVDQRRDGNGWTRRGIGQKGDQRRQIGRRLDQDLRRLDLFDHPGKGPGAGRGMVTDRRKEETACRLHKARQGAELSHPSP